jgi:hypothetical protein
VHNLVYTCPIVGRNTANGSNQTWVPRTMPYSCQMVWGGYSVRVHRLICTIS